MVAPASGTGSGQDARLLILLPPSEGKTAPAAGAPLDPGSLVFAGELGEPRQRLLSALLELCGGPVETAAETLELGVRQAGEVARNRDIPTAAAGPAAAVYTGVLYDRLGFGTLSEAARGRAGSHLLIASALWGVLRPDDRIPYYRLSMKPKLDGIGGLAAFWRPALAAAFTGSGHDREGNLVLDLRSGAYSAAWKPREARLLPVRAFREEGGERKVISHMAKAVRGEVARLVLEAPEIPADPSAVAALAERAGMRVELAADGLDVIVAGD